MNSSHLHSSLHDVDLFLGAGEPTDLILLDLFVALITIDYCTQLNASLPGFVCDE